MVLVAGIRRWLSNNRLTHPASDAILDLRPNPDVRQGAIAASGRDGPYVASDFTCSMSGAGGFQPRPQPGITQTTIAYKATQFGG